MENRSAISRQVPVQQAESSPRRVVSDLLQGSGAPLAGRLQSASTVAGNSQHVATLGTLQRIANHGQPSPIQRQIADLEGGQASTLSQVAHRATAGLPQNLKSGIESLSGYRMDHVQVHYNSSKPAQLQALAYAQGSEIHLGAGQERHLPHEAWHVVQQMQGRVKPTLQAKGWAINDDPALEKEADIMGAKAMQPPAQRVAIDRQASASPAAAQPIQRKIGYELEFGEFKAVRHPESKLELKKGLVIGDGREGYQITLDELPSGEFDIEVIFPEVDEEKEGARDKMIQVITTAEAEVNLLASKLKGIPPTPAKIPQRRGGNFGLINDLVMSMRGAARLPQGKLQSTVGLNLAGLAFVRNAGAEAITAEMKIPKIEDTKSDSREKVIAARGTVISATKVDPLMAKSVAKNMTTFLNSTGFKSLSAGSDFQELVALATMMIELPIRSRLLPFPYPKAVAGDLLHRTDFATLFGMLSAPMRGHLKTFATTWSMYMLDCVDEVVVAKRGRSDAGPAKDMTPEEAKEHNSYSDRKVIGRHTGAIGNNWDTTMTKPHPDYGGELRMLIWFESVVRNQIDYLTKANYPGDKDQKDWIESYGGYGNKVDHSAKLNEDRGIFEFRAFAQASDVLAQAMTIWDLVLLANSKKKR